jgi:hypothetical protein
MLFHFIIIIIIIIITQLAVVGPLRSSGSINVLEVFRRDVLGFEGLVIPHGEILNTLKSQLQQPGVFFPL